MNTFINNEQRAKESNNPFENTPVVKTTLFDDLSPIEVWLADLRGSIRAKIYNRRIRKRRKGVAVVRLHKSHDINKPIKDEALERIKRGEGLESLPTNISSDDLPPGLTRIGNKVKK